MLDEITPSVTAESPVVTSPEGTQGTVTPEESYELPDGTKVSAEELSKQWRDNFYPEFTRRSQELAALKTKAPEVKAPVEDSPWARPEWEPKTYQELAESLIPAAEKRVWEKILAESEREQKEADERENYINQEVEQLKAVDAKVDVNKVKSYAAKYAFNSLLPAYQNMRAMEDAEKRAEERVLKNIKSRSGEPVGTSSGNAGQEISFPPDVKTGLEKARWILRNQH